MVFGPALIKAYELESKSAIYPRIILDPQLADAWGQGEVFIDRDGSLLGQSKTWRSSHDGFRFFDFLQPFGGTHDFQNSSGLIKMKLEPLREILKRCLEQHRSNSGVWQKYVWLANYFNTVCIEHTGHDVAPLEINW